MGAGVRSLEEAMDAVGMDWDSTVSQTRETVRFSVIYIVRKYRQTELIREVLERWRDGKIVRRKGASENR